MSVLDILLFLTVIVQTLNFMFNMHEWRKQRRLRRKIDAIDRELPL